MHRTSCARVVLRKEPTTVSNARHLPKAPLALSLLIASAAASEEHYRCQFDTSGWETAYRVGVKNYLDELDPAVEYPRARELKTFAARGEYEPLAFVIYAGKDLKSVQVEVTDLKSDAGLIASDNLTVRTVVRGPRRFTYRSPVEDHRVVSRFLFRFKPFDLRAGHFREIWLTVKAPEDAAPGVYSGRIVVRPDGRRATALPVRLEVLPFKLRPSPKKRYGVYHNVKTDAQNRERSKRELIDIREHGGSLIYPVLYVRYETKPDGGIAISYDEIENGLELIREVGLAGPVVINTGFTALQRRLKLKHEELPTSDAFRSTARQAIEGLKPVQRRFPEIEIALTHLDEVFGGRDRLPRYIAMTKAAQQVPGFRFYITFHTVGESAEPLRRQLDPYVDIRGHHGYSFEWWLSRGHTFEEYERELRESGDEAWFYLNPNRIWRDAKLQRLVNGLYMWLSPFSGRLDWGHSKPEDDPFNDLDGKSTDTGYVFWSPAEPDDLVPTRDWEAWREGIEDVSYLLMLESLIRQQEKTSAARAAAQWLADLRARMPKPQGLKYATGPTPKRDASESPFILALRKTFSSDDLQKIRYEAARHISRLSASEGD